MRPTASRRDPAGRAGADPAPRRSVGGLLLVVLLVGTPVALLTRPTLAASGRWWPLLGAGAGALAVVAALLAARGRTAAAVAVGLAASAALAPLPVPWPLPIAPLVVASLVARHVASRHRGAGRGPVSATALLFGLLAGGVAAAVALAGDQVILLEVGGGLPAVPTPLLLVAAACANGLSEEVAWRAVPRQLTRLGTVPLVAVTSASFAAAHLSSGVPSGIAGVVAAAAFAVVVGWAHFGGRWSLADVVRCHVVTDLTFLAVLDTAGRVWT